MAVPSMATDGRQHDDRRRDAIDLPNATGRQHHDIWGTAGFRPAVHLWVPNIHAGFG